jgi:hypothetical protein
MGCYEDRVEMERHIAGLKQLLEGTGRWCGGWGCLVPVRLDPPHPRVRARPGDHLGQAELTLRISGTAH